MATCTHNLHGTLIGEGGLEIRGHLHSQDLHRLILEAVGDHKLLGGDDGCPSAVGGGAALQLGEGAGDLRGVEDLVYGILVLELGIPGREGKKHMVKLDFLCVCIPVYFIFFTSFYKT